MSHVKKHKRKYVAGTAAVAIIVGLLQVFGILGPVLCSFSSDPAKCEAAAAKAAEAAVKLDEEVLQ